MPLPANGNKDVEVAGPDLPGYVDSPHWHC